MYNIFSKAVTLALLSVDLLWLLSDIKHKANFDQDSSMLGWALLSLCFVFVAILHTLVTSTLIATRPGFRNRMQYILLLTNIVLIAIFLTLWVPEG